MLWHAVLKCKGEWHQREGMAIREATQEPYKRFICAMESARTNRALHACLGSQSLLCVCDEEIGWKRKIRPTTMKVLAQQTQILHWKHLLCLQPHLAEVCLLQHSQSTEELSAFETEIGRNRHLSPMHSLQPSPRLRQVTHSDHPTNKGCSSVLGDHPQPRGKAARYTFKGHQQLLVLWAVPWASSAFLLTHFAFYTHCFGLDQSNHRNTVVARGNVPLIKVCFIEGRRLSRPLETFVL